MSDGVEWARACWLSRALGGARLVSLLVRQGPQLVAILPLVVSRGSPFRTARPLACMTTEYCPLLTDRPDAAGVWTAMADALRELRAVDAVVLPYVRHDAALAALIKNAERVVETDSFPTHFMDWSTFGSWENYWRQLPRVMTSNLARQRRRLNELGDVHFEELTDFSARCAAWRWMLARKRDWLVRKGLDHAFIPTDEYARFTEATLGISGPGGRRTVFVLKLNGELIAAELVNVDRRRLEGFVCAYDPTFARFAPGQLLRKELLQWAFARGLDFDWRLGEEPYKRQWASHTGAATTYVLARNFRGRLFGAYLSARTWLAYRTPARLRATMRDTLRRCNGAERRARRLGGKLDRG